MAAPEQGDVVWLDYDPQAGHEQAGRRPSLVLSPKAYNAATGLMLCCPVTSQVKGYPFEVELVGVKGVTGVVLSDQVRNLDWEARRADRVGKAADDVLADVVAKVTVLLPVR
ncbi:MAG TPA: endoribonuclease MazF [Methylibium sp.]|uniref:endoribonuclease MazF n=1 Tax=Methylibium sp. TaxID=2067992 RepID=UPI002DB7EE87|nr:endoribonuclease MazF [Methylibium sp.]HEU4458815.1 endoribonuclease MazF [Methylibium sp.]